jgi:hypothetical protein
MPMILVYGTPEGIGQDRLKTICDKIIKRVCGIKQLNIGIDGVSVFFPKDHLKIGLGEEIIIFVDCLTDKPERTDRLRNELAAELVNLASDEFPEAKLVECFIRPFRMENGFAAYRK